MARKKKNYDYSKLSIESVGSFLDYNPETGIFTWKVDRRSGLGAGKLNAAAGSVAGYADNRGYIFITVEYTKILAHRLAWFLTAGEWSTNEIDHIDGNKSNNSWKNLRHVDRRTNSENQIRPMKSGSSGALGVSKRERAGKIYYEARIMLNGKYIHLGKHETLEAASNAYLQKKREIHSGCTI